MTDIKMNTDKMQQHTHRVGTITAGLCMVGFGILFLINSIWDKIGYEMIFSLWPLILVGLGTELFVSNFEEKKIVYDKAAVFLLIIMTFFAMVMAAMDICMESVQLWGYRGF